MATAPKEMSGTWRVPQPGRRIRSGPEAQPTLVLLLEGIGSSKEIRSIASGDARILQQVGQVFLRILLIERKIRSTGFENTK
jgi:hypothetical protein